MPNTEPPVPALVPVADWSRVRILLDGEPLLGREGEMLHRHPQARHAPRLVGVGLDASHPRRYYLRRGVSYACCRWQTGRRGCNFIQLSLDRDDVDVRLEASFAMAGLGMEPMRLEQDLGAWQYEGTGKGVAMGRRRDVASSVTSRWPPTSRSRCAGPGGGAPRPGRLPNSTVSSRWHGADTPQDDPAPPAAPRWRATVRWAGAPCLRRTRPPGMRVGLQATYCIEGDEELQRALRFAVYHLTSAANPEDGRVSIGARALTGDAYLGHVFWDTEIYLLPFYTAVWPEAARALLMYRYHTLPGARAKAVHFGFKGALYAWESADTGMETTPERVVVPDGTVVEILTGQMEHHISADVAYAVWRYWRATGDDDFFLRAGAEILLDTARFWASRALPEADGRRHIRHVIGPDEYHEDVDDNAFTNVMARWNIARALEAVDLLQARWPDQAAALRQKLALGDDELADWRDAIARIVTGLDPATGIYEQFAGFHALEPLDLAAYAERTVPIDVVIGRERTQRSQVVKQADVVALMALLPEEFPGATAERNFRHYEPRCAHGSSLSAGMHAASRRASGRYRDGAALSARDRSHRPRPRPQQRRWRAHRRAGRALAGGDARLCRPRPERRHAWDRPEAPAPMARPLVPRVLERPVRSDPHCW